MALRLVLGLVKGAVIGGALGYGAHELGLDGGWAYVIYGLVGFAVGLFVGRPIWSHLIDKKSTVWTSFLKGLFGFGVGCGLYALAHNVLPDPAITIAGESHTLSQWPYLFGGIFGALYGAWIEVDDAPVADPDALPKLPKKSK
jgi:hypothetical protein